MDEHATTELQIRKSLHLQLHCSWIRWNQYSMSVRFWLHSRLLSWCMWELFIASWLEGPSQVQEQISGAIFCHGLQLWCAKQHSHTKHYHFFFAKASMQRKTNLWCLKMYQKEDLKQPLQAWAPGTTSYQWLFQWCSLASRWGIDRKRGSWMSRCWQKDEVKPKKLKKRVEANVLFLKFESFDVIHCSIWQKLSWVNYHGVTWPPKVLCLHQVPRKNIPLELHHYLADDLWKTRLQLTLAYPSRHCGHRGHCGHHIEGGQKGCYVRWIMKIPKLKIPWFRFQGWLVSRQERPTTSSSRVRQVSKASGGETGVSGGTFFYFNSSGLIA